MQKSFHEALWFPFSIKGGESCGWLLLSIVCLIQAAMDTVQILFTLKRLKDILCKDLGIRNISILKSVVI